MNHLDATPTLPSSIYTSPLPTILKHDPTSPAAPLNAEQHTPRHKHPGFRLAYLYRPTRGGAYRPESEALRAVRRGELNLDMPYLWEAS